MLWTLLTNSKFIVYIEQYIGRKVPLLKPPQNPHCYLRTVDHAKDPLGWSLYEKALDRSVHETETFMIQLCAFCYRTTPGNDFTNRDYRHRDKGMDK